MFEGKSDQQKQYDLRLQSESGRLNALRLNENVRQLGRRQKGRMLNNCVLNSRNKIEDQQNDRLAG